MLKKKIKWLCIYTVHLIVACVGSLFLMFVLDFFIRPGQRFDLTLGPYFLGAAVCGSLLGLTVGRKAKSSILALLWVIPALLIFWDLQGWWRHPYAGQNLPQHFYNTYIGRNCGDSECLGEAFGTTPLLSAIYYGAAALITKLILRKRDTARNLSVLACTVITILTLLGCNSTPVHTTSTITTAQTSTQYPPRPTTPPPPFKLFHQSDNGAFTLVTTPTATDEQIEAIVWQLRDAAHARTFDKLGIPQKVVDARDPMVWFHIYRGPKCADEKYTDGKLPCGDHYNASGDYTFGGGVNHQWDDGALLHHSATGEDQQTELWNPNAK